MQSSTNNNDFLYYFALVKTISDGGEANDDDYSLSDGVRRRNKANEIKNIKPYQRN